ncbi:MAG TPA: hypothetical protein VNO26_10465 [Candidatus Limnocylindria bacterium]|nr:hypothetical protein [Candidatus Limnocylindria bacterium]
MAISWSVHGVPNALAVQASALALAWPPGQAAAGSPVETTTAQSRPL